MNFKILLSVIACFTCLAIGWLGCAFAVHNGYDVVYDKVTSVAQIIAIVAMLGFALLIVWGLFVYVVASVAWSISNRSSRRKSSLEDKNVHLDVR